MRSLLPYAVGLHLCGLLVALVLGYSAGRMSHQNVNELLADGWLVADPDGYAVEHFDDGFWTILPNYKAEWSNHPSYWTTEPKGDHNASGN